MITLDPTTILDVDLPTLRDKVEAKKNLLVGKELKLVMMIYCFLLFQYLKPTKINYEPRKKAKGKGGSVNIAKNKKILQEEARKEFVKQKKELVPFIQQESISKRKDRSPHVLDRFLPKTKDKK